MASSPRISVVMPVYNAEKYLAQAIESVLGQTFSDFEFLIFNDGSTDSSASIIASYAARDPRIVFSDDAHNKGYVPRLNEGLAKARGEYIARMDADDISLLERFATQIAFMDRHPAIGLLGSSIDLIDSQNKRRKGWRFMATPEETRVHFLFTNYVAHPTVMMRKSAIEHLEYRAHYMPAEDYDLWCRISEKSGVYCINSPLLLYRTHEGSTSQANAATSRARVIEILKLELERLGLKPTDDDAAFHNELSFDQIKYDAKGLARATEWYEKIYFTNLVTKKYPPQLLLSTLVGRWYVICRRADNAWFLPVKPFWKSRLISLDGLTFGEKISFFLSVSKKLIRYLFFW